MHAVRDLSPSILQLQLCRSGTMSLEDRFHPLAPTHTPTPVQVADRPLVQPRLDNALENFRGFGKRERRRREQRRKLQQFLKKHRFPDVKPSGIRDMIPSP
eukprot:s1474_g14.t1